MAKKMSLGDKIRALRKKGLSYSQIAKAVKCHISTVVYHLNPKVKAAHIKHSKEWHKSEEGKKYKRERFKARYKDDTKFREEHLARLRKAGKKRREQTKANKEARIGESIKPKKTRRHIPVVKKEEKKEMKS